MPSKIDEIVFSEPSGRPHALIQFSGALVLLSLYVFFTVVQKSTSSSWILFPVVGSALSGIAESLPKNRRRTAGALRLTAIFVLVCLIVTTVFAPGFVG